MYVGQQDPIGLSAGKLNLYSYVDEPNGWSDPFGLGVCPLIVRGGESSAENLLTNQAKDARGHISCNLGVDLDKLATTPTSFPNGKLTVTTSDEIKNLGKGWDLIPDPTINNPLHGSIITPNNPMTQEEAGALSKIFNKIPNIWK